MKKKKALSVLLASAMVVSLAACGSTSDSSSSSSSSDTTATSSSSSSTDTSAATTEEAEPYNLTELTVVVNGTFNIDQGEAGWDEFIEQWETYVSEAIGHDITLNIQKLDHSGYTDAVGRLFASQDYPDVIIMSADMFKQYAPTGLLWDMADAYDNAEFQSRVTLPAINENLKDSEGHLYGFAPTYGNGCVTYVKQSWLDAVGIDINDIKTYDDYYNMLLAFHNGDPDGNGVDGDTYGVIAAGFLGNEAPYINYLPEFWQDAYPSILQDDDGVWYDGFQTDATKQALLRLQQAYQDGAIDPETLTASTKIAREKWFSNDQTGSSGVFTYWAGTWYQTLTNNLVKNDVDSDLVQLAPIQEISDSFGGYLNREAPVWAIVNYDGDDARCQAVFDAFIETMMDGDKVQTLWEYGAEGVHWSTEAESFKTNEGTDKEKAYEYADGEFHLRQSPGDVNTVYSKNAIDPALCIAPLTNGYYSATDLQQAGNEFFTENCVDAPASPASDTWTNESGTIYDAKLAAVTSVVMEGGDVDAAMQTYVDTVGSIIDQILSELN
jgi:multiple sugar transport system substrate-binding protein/putative aldouronate transport system substrate-binding protein